MKISICAGAYRGQDVRYHLGKVQEHGLHGLEFYDWVDLGDPQAFAKELEKHDAVINSTCTPFFNLVDGSKQEQYLDGIRRTVEACKILGIRSIISQTGDVIPGLSREAHIAQMVETLKKCAALLDNSDIVLELEPLNELNHPGHFLQRSDEAVRIVDAVGSPNVKLVFDVYHQQVTEGDVTRNLTNCISRINHFHIADNPGRQQPGTGELNYANILAAIQNTGFDGFVGLECGYTVDTDQALEQFKRDVLAKLPAKI